MHELLQQIVAIEPQIVLDAQSVLDVDIHSSFIFVGEVSYYYYLLFHTQHSFDRPTSQDITHPTIAHKWII